VLATLGDSTACRRVTLEQAHLTHRHPLSDAATLSLARMTQELLDGHGRHACRDAALDLVEAHAEFRFDPWPGRTTGYVVDTVQTVLDAFFNRESFEECLVDVVNRGGDADTTGALAGQLAGAHFGVQAIPTRWLKRLDPKVHAEIRAQVEGLLALADARLHVPRVRDLCRL
jgi:ADP-ribosyl-[dinitrogen reductase] hydrolase